MNATQGTDSKRVRVQRFYDSEVTRYRDDRYLGESCEHLSYQFRKEIVVGYLADASGKVFDLGCGPAIYTTTLSDLGFEVSSVDLSFEMLRQARSLVPAGFVGNWINCEIDRLPLQGGVADTVMAIGVLAYSDRPADALAEFVRCARPGATLVVQCSNILSPTAAAYILKDRLLYVLRIRERHYDFKLVRYRLGALLSLLEEAGFEPVAYARYDFRLPFLERVAPTFTRKMMTILQNSFAESKLFGWMAEGFVIKAKRR